MEAKRIEFNDDHYQMFLIMGNNAFYCLPSSYDWEILSLEPEQGFNVNTKTYHQKTKGDARFANWFSISVEPVFENNDVLKYLQGKGYIFPEDIETFISEFETLDILNIKLEKINL